MIKSLQFRAQVMTMVLWKEYAQIVTKKNLYPTLDYVTWEMEILEINLGARNADPKQPIDNTLFLSTMEGKVP